jgi:hypothetical protein
MPEIHAKKTPIISYHINRSQLMPEIHAKKTPCGAWRKVARKSWRKVASTKSVDNFYCQER